jgi:hypothetical protein
VLLAQRGKGKGVKICHESWQECFLNFTKRIFSYGHEYGLLGRNLDFGLTIEIQQLFFKEVAAVKFFQHPCHLFNVFSSSSLLMTDT